MVLQVIYFEYDGNILLSDLHTVKRLRVAIDIV